MNNKFDELTKNMAQSVTRRGALKKFGLTIASLVLAGAANLASAQTSAVCDAAGDATFSNGKGGPKVPAWFDVVQSEVTDAGSYICFTLTLNDDIPAAPAWNLVDDGGQLWWGWRFVNDLAQAAVIKDGCVKAAGQLIPSAYFVDLIWDVTSSSFQARLLDDTTCVQIDVPFVISSDRTQFTLVVSKNLLTNGALIPNPNAFHYVVETVVWKPNSTGNNGFFPIDRAPNDSDGLIVVAPWSASENFSFFCE